MSEKQIRKREDYDPDTQTTYVVTEEVVLDEDGNIDRVTDVIDIQPKK